ncbi:hypothetical protein MMUC44124_12805 [Mycolicibacterium mucogenicum DSM 44124]|nr:hypothetical protein MMUC44124_12805 [Mycolicibacterium mucogenicum DSM 44124]
MCIPRIDPTTKRDTSIGTHEESLSAASAIPISATTLTTFMVFSVPSSLRPSAAS